MSEEMETKIEVQDTKSTDIDIIDSIRQEQKQINQNSETDSTETKAEVVDIPEDFSSFCVEDGWSQEEIDAFVKDKSAEELAEDFEYLKGMHESEEVDLGEEEKEKKAEEKPAIEEKGDEKVNIDAEAEQRIREQVTKEILEKFNDKFNTMDNISQQQKDAEHTQTWKTIHKKLDEVSKDFPIFGEYDKLPKIPAGKLKGQPVMTSPGHKARAEVFQDFTAFRQLGRSVDRSIDDALALYAGKHLKTETKRNVYRDLKKHESNLSGSRTGKTTQKQYSSSREEIVDFIKQQQRASGQDV